jgi:hypothetical protein
MQPRMTGSCRRRTGGIDGLPGQTWQNWNASIYQCQNGLTREGLTGLPGLFRLYGLKTGMKENADAIKTAWQRLEQKGRHGLQPTAEPSSRGGRPHKNRRRAPFIPSGV